MEEKVLIKSERYNFKKVFIVFWILCALFIVVLLIKECPYPAERYEDCYNTYLEHRERGSCGWSYKFWERCYECEAYLEHPHKITFVLSHAFNSLKYGYLPLIKTDVILALLGGLIYLWLHNYELTITDKRAYGKTAFGKRVDLPLDSISAVGSSWLKGIAVATASGRISFLLIKNQDEIHKCVSDLLIERQNKSPSDTTMKQETPRSDAEELKKYKDLLDSGVITQEEFNAKKKQLLGL